MSCVVTGTGQWERISKSAEAAAVPQDWPAVALIDDRSIPVTHSASHTRRFGNPVVRNTVAVSTGGRRAAKGQSQNSVFSEISALKAQVKLPLDCRCVKTRCSSSPENLWALVSNDQSSARDYENSTDDEELPEELKFALKAIAAVFPVFRASPSTTVRIVTAVTVIRGRVRTRVVTGPGDGSEIRHVRLCALPEFVPQFLSGRSGEMRKLFRLSRLRPIRRL